MFSLKVKIEGPQVLDKIDLSKIDSSVRPKGLTKRQVSKYTTLRDRLDSGWGWSFRQVVNNFKRTKALK